MGPGMMQGGGGMGMMQGPGGPPSGGLVSAIMDRMQPQARENGSGLNKVQVVQSLVQDIHDAQRIFNDPAHVAILARMQVMATTLQKELMAPTEGPMKGAA